MVLRERKLTEQENEIFSAIGNDWTNLDTALFDGRYSMTFLHTICKTLKFRRMIELVDDKYEDGSIELSAKRIIVKQ